MKKYIKFNNSEKYLDYFKVNYDERIKFIEYISKKNNSKNFHIDGYCLFCDSPASFFVDWEYSNNIVPNYREKLVCTNCQLNNRQRFMAFYIKMYLDKNINITVYLYEQVTNFYSNFYNKYSKNININIIGSEYLGYDKIGSQVYNGIRHEDAMNLSFDDDFIDLIVSQDVLEHVPNYIQAIKETYRVLKKNGIFIFSIPFYIASMKSEQRASLENDGSINYIMDPIYHGNPVDKDGSLVFHDFGWDIFDVFKNIGFETIDLVSYHNYFYGHIGEADQFCFIAKK